MGGNSVETSTTVTGCSMVLVPLSLSHISGKVSEVSGGGLHCLLAFRLAVVTPPTHFQYKERSRIHSWTLGPHKSSRTPGTSRPCQGCADEIGEVCGHNLGRRRHWTSLIAHLHMLMSLGICLRPWQCTRLTHSTRLCCQPPYTSPPPPSVSYQDHRAGPWGLHCHLGVFIGTLEEINSTDCLSFSLITKAMLSSNALSFSSVEFNDLNFHES